MKYFHKTGPASAGIAFGSSPHCAALAVGMFFTFLGQAEATIPKIINAASPSFVDVTTAIAAAVDGDTVIVPAGTASWTSTLTITKGISLIGQTTTNPVAKTANDQTIILDNEARPVGGGSNPVIKLQPGDGKTCRVSGLTFRPGTNTNNNFNGMIVLNGTYGSQVRLDTCHFANGLHQTAAINEVSGYGVVDHNVFDCLTVQALVFRNGTWVSQAREVNQGQGDGSFADPPFFGSEKFIFFEDNCLNYAGHGGSTDGDYGGRVVFRHNHCYDFQLANHGTEGRFRGTRAMEWYNNDFHFTTFYGQTGGLRSSTLLSYNNTYDGTNQTNGPSLQVYRSFFLFPGDPFLAASGDTSWDVNDTEGNGTYVAGHSPHLYASGTVSSGSTTTLIDTTKNWTTNQWVGFTAKRVSDNRIALITGNTSNTLTVIYRSEQGGGVTWATGNSYQIHRCLVVLDQPGRGQCDLITGFTPTVNSTTGTAIWPHQKLEPCYSWNEIYSPGAVQMNIQTGCTSLFHENRDFYNQAAAVGGAQLTGVGVGTFANRPATGVAGVDISGATPHAPGTGYWATDTQTLYVYTDQGWQTYYTPYTYPHPLVSGATPTPTAPTNLRVTGP